VDIAVARIGAIVREKPRYIGAQLVHGRHHHMARILLVELPGCARQDRSRSLDPDPTPCSSGSALLVSIDLLLTSDFAP